MAEISVKSIHNLTSRIERTNEYIQIVFNMLQGKTQAEADIIIAELSIFLSAEFNSIRDDIVAFARGQYCSILKLMEPLEPLLDLNILDLGSVIDAVKAIIALLLGPYYKALALQAELILAIAELSLALVNAAANITPPTITGLNINLPTITMNPISIGDFTNCPVDTDTVTGDFDNFPTLA